MEHKDSSMECLYHISGEQRLANVEEKMNSIGTKMNIGIGLFLAASLVVGTLFYSLDRVEAHMMTTQAAHERAIKEEQGELVVKLATVEGQLNELTTEVAVLQSQLNTYNKNIIAQLERIGEKK